MLIKGHKVGGAKELGHLVGLGGAVLQQTVQRYFTQINAAFGQRYEFPTVTLTGDFEVEFTAMLNSGHTDVAHILLGNKTDTSSTVFVFTSNNQLRVRDSSGAYGVDAGVAVKTGVLQSYLIKRVGSNVKAYVDGVLAVNFISTAAYVFDLIGTYSGYAYHTDGIISNVKITDNGTLVACYKLDENWISDSIVVNSAPNASGPELWNDAPTVLGSWVDNSDSTFSLSGTGGSILQDTNNIVEDHKTYLVTYTVSEGMTGGVRALVYGSSKVGVGLVRGAGGTYTQRLTVSTNTSSGIPSGKVAFQSYSDFNGTISDISVKRVDGYGKAISIVAEDAPLFTQIDIGWLGENLDTGQFATASNALGGATITTDFANRSLEVTAPGINSGYPRMTLDFGSVIGNKYRVSGSSSGFATPGLAVRFATSGATALVAPDVGIYSKDVIAEASALQMLVDGTKLGTSSFDNVSVRRILEVS